MKEYLLILFGVCVLAAIVRVISPDGVMKNYIELICALCVIAAIAAPLSQILSEIGDVDISISENQTNMENYDEIYNLYLAEGSLDDAERILEQELEAVFLQGSGDVDVNARAQTCEDGVKVVGIDVTLIGGAVLADPEAVIEYVLARTGVECQIIYELYDEKQNK